MKKIIRSLREYLSEEFHLPLFIFTAVFLAACILLNYTYDIEKVQLESLKSGWLKIAGNFAFYFMPWAVILIAQSAFRNRWHEIRQPELWIALCIGVFALAFANWVPWHRTLAQLYFHGREQLFVKKCLWNVKNTVFYTAPIFLYWLIREKDKRSFYGLTLRGFDPKPYLLMLGIMLPLICAVSFTEDFQHAYPSYRPDANARVFGLPRFAEMGVYELFYGGDFTFVEVFFRGFLVIGLGKWLGKGSILPMVGMYCFLHFGKPVGETISSCFGGLILGVIALETRSVFGGVLIHMGVAWLMDAAAFLQMEIAR